ncbi:hypothetical protein ACFL52_01005 [Candidatus Margulisiibacteriota bacterium]
MKKYNSVEVSEKQLEDLIRQGTDLIEDGLQYIDHQRSTDRGPLDLLMVDSGHALVVAELKVVEDDSMLFQGIDYYDYTNKNVEGVARVYKKHEIDPNQDSRLFLIAPSFSQALINRCKWIDIPISLFMYKCIAFDDNPKEISIVFSEISIPTVPEIVKAYNIDDKLNYITDPKIRTLMSNLLEDIKKWDTENILIEPTKYDLSLKISGRVFSYFAPRRKHFMIYTYDESQKWTGYPVHQKQDIDVIIDVLKYNVNK